MENAKWRQEQREQNVKKYKEQDEKEDIMLKKMQQEKDGEAFLKYYFFVILNKCLSENYAIMVPSCALYLRHDIQ